VCLYGLLGGGDAEERRIWVTRREIETMPKVGCRSERMAPVETRRKRITRPDEKTFDEDGNEVILAQAGSSVRRCSDPCKPAASAQGAPGDAFRCLQEPLEIGSPLSPESSLRALSPHSAPGTEQSRLFCILAACAGCTSPTRPLGHITRQTIHGATTSRCTQDQTRSSNSGHSDGSFVNHNA